jgi:hypothetical protein
MKNRMMSRQNRFVRGNACEGFVLVVLLALASSTLAQPPGGGTSVNPWQISQLNHLDWMRRNIWVSTSGQYYKLMNDIDASVTASWNGGGGFEPIPVNVGDNSVVVFDGNNKVIRNLTIKAPNNKIGAGLFKSFGIGWLVKNLGLENVAVAGAYNYVGGLVGRNGGTISGCYVIGSVSVEPNLSSVGGLVGRNEYRGTVTKCYVIGSVRGAYADIVGGLVGENNGRIIDCYSAATVTRGLQVGGLVGHNMALGTVTRCYATGRVSGGSYTGGLTGYIPNMPLSGSVRSSYWDKQTSGQSMSAGGTGRSTAQMKRRTTFVGWDFSNIWRITEGLTYPSLRLRSAGDVYEPDNSLISAKPIANGRTQRRSIHAAGDTDWAKFTVGGRGARNLVIETRGTTGDTVMWLYDRRGRHLAYDDDSGPGRFSRIRRSSLPAGTYSIRVQKMGNNGTIASYTLQTRWTPR